MAQLLTNLLAMTRKAGYVQAGVFAANHNLDWIANMSNVTIAAAAETPNGTTTTFTFTSAPRYVVYNGQLRYENDGYTRSGSTIQLTDAYGQVFAPLTGDSVKAIL